MLVAQQRFWRTAQLVCSKKTQNCTDSCEQTWKAKLFNNLEFSCYSNKKPPGRLSEMGKQKCTVWAQQAHCETKHWQHQWGTSPPTCCWLECWQNTEETPGFVFQGCTRTVCPGPSGPEPQRSSRWTWGQMAAWTSHFTLKSLLPVPKFRSTVDQRKSLQNLERYFWQS